MLTPLAPPGSNLLLSGALYVLLGSGQEALLTPAWSEDVLLGLIINLVAPEKSPISNKMWVDLLCETHKLR